MSLEVGTDNCCVRSDHARVYHQMWCILWVFCVGCGSSNRLLLQSRLAPVDECLIDRAGDRGKACPSCKRKGDRIGGGGSHTPSLALIDAADCGTALARPVPLVQRLFPQPVGAAFSHLGMEKSKLHRRSHREQNSSRTTLLWDSATLLLATASPLFA